MFCMDVTLRPMTRQLRVHGVAAFIIRNLPGSDSGPGRNVRNWGRDSRTPDIRRPNGGSTGCSCRTSPMWAAQWRPIGRKRARWLRLSARAACAPVPGCSMRVAPRPLSNRFGAAADLRPGWIVPGRVVRRRRLILQQRATNDDFMLVNKQWEHPGVNKTGRGNCSLSFSPNFGPPTQHAATLCGRDGGGWGAR